MDTIRKWWNKPKADDKSILARFYYADKALTAVASELDSFDGRAEPERCSRLVGRLRQGQDQVLAITNIIMDELLGEDRAPRTFRAKFPEEVLQESLAGQLWFGAECLAAGSSIMNREAESAQMRPFAKAVTKSLNHVRNLLREQCLRNKTPNSLTLNLDLNDAVTETLYESLKIFDRLFAEFELLYVSAMVQVKSKQEHEMQELICVLFSETLQRALRIGLLEQEQVDYYDPALMFSIPRLAIVAGLVIYTKGPLNMSTPADQLSEMFRPFRTLLIKIRELLRTLNAHELYQLEKLLCTNEDIHISTSNVENELNEFNGKSIGELNFNCDSDDEGKFIESNSSASSTSSDSQTSTNQSNIVNNSIHDSSGSESNFNRNFTSNDLNIDDLPSNLHVNSVWANASFNVSDEATLLDESESQSCNKPEWNNECASGYLIPNTNFGNLLQTNDTPLTDSFISSDDEYTQKTLTDEPFEQNDTMDTEADMAAIQSMIENVQVCEDDNVQSMPGPCNLGESTSFDQSVVQKTWYEVRAERVQRMNDRVRRVSTTDLYNPNTIYHSYASSSYHRRPDEMSKKPSWIVNYEKHNHSNREPKAYRGHSSSRHSSRHRSRHRSNRTTEDRVSISSTSCIYSEGDSNVWNSGRMKFKTTENLLHRLFVCIAGVADQLQTNFASDLRQILRSVFLMNVSPPMNNLDDIGDKSKDSTSDLFEFRASENDVIQEDGGSNHSIYSAEEANPEMDAETTINGSNSSSLETEIRITHIGNQNDESARPLSLVVTTTNQIQCVERNGNVDNCSFDNQQTRMTNHNNNNINNNINNNNNNNSNPTSRNDSSTVTTTTIILTTNSRLNRNLNEQPQQITETPPRWIPDEEAAQCMSCSQTFTTFRRRHHCRCCGGVFCGICSNSQAPLPKFGLNKAVRVCRTCFSMNAINGSAHT